jgi:RNA polymerase sigma factor (sigma-70 family)
LSPWLSDLFLASQSDERLVSLARAGHDRAFVAIVERYNRELYSLARRLGAHGRTEDVLQQAFLSAFAALQAGAEVSHLRGWLHQIVRNAAIKSAARAPDEGELDDEVVAAGRLEDEVERRLMVRATFAELAKLPEHQRDALVKTAVQGRSRTEVAVSMGTSEGAVRQLVHRGRATLRAAVTAITPYPLAAWVASADRAPGIDRVTEIAVGAGSASAGAVAVKAGAVVVATGALATGIVASHGRHHPSHAAPPARAAALVSGSGGGAGEAGSSAAGGGGESSVPVVANGAPLSSSAAAAQLSAGQWGANVTSKRNSGTGTGDDGGSRAATGAQQTTTHEGGTSGGDRGGTSGGDRGGTSGGDRGGTSGGDRGGTSGGDRGGTSGGDRGGTSGGDRSGATGGGRVGAPTGGDHTETTGTTTESQTTPPPTGTTTESHTTPPPTGTTTESHLTPAPPGD